MKDGYLVNCTVPANFLLDKGRVAENLQKECLCYFIMKNLREYVSRRKLNSNTIRLLYGINVHISIYRYTNTYVIR